MTAFDRAWKKLLDVEGDFSNHPDDRGGQTRYGVTELTARKHGYRGEMFHLPPDLARRIAKTEYWDALRLDEIAAEHEGVAFELLDIGYNMGPATAGRYLQRALNVLNRAERDYPDLKVDGHVGPITLARLHALAEVRGSQGMRVVVRALNALQGARYIELGEERAKNQTFVFGWLLHRVPLLGGLD